MARVAGIGSSRQSEVGMDLRQIEYFVALYDERSITKAASRLNVVQPALSMQISRLERTFKTRLFERTSRGVVPTDLGRTFYGLCQKILSDVYEAQRYLRDASGKVTGDLTVGLMPSVANSVLPAVLAEYKSSYPDVTLRIVEAYSGSLLDQLNSGKLDLAIVNNSSNLGRIAIMPLFRDYLVLVTRYKTGKKVPLEIPSQRISGFPARPSVAAPGHARSHRTRCSHRRASSLSRKSSSILSVRRSSWFARATGQPFSRSSQLSEQAIANWFAFSA